MTQKQTSAGPKTHELVATTMPDLSASVRQKTMRIIQDDEKRMQELLPENNPERRKFPEHMFREHFLPIVSGEAFKRLPEGYTPQRLRDEATDLWAQVAGSMGAEVEVVEQDGSTAFIFPALMNTSGLKTRILGDDPGLAPYAKEYMHSREGMPYAADAVLTSGLTSKLSRLLGDDGDKVTSDMMDKVYAYYNLKPEKAEEEKTAAPKINPDDYEF